MNIDKTLFPGLLVMTPKVFEDNRGFFMETFNQRAFEQAGVPVQFVQDNHARSEHKGVLRGLHFQLPPSSQAKLVRVTAGTVFDVVVDLRIGSPTFGLWYGLELSAENKRQLFIPRGFAHGYQTLTPEVEFQYKVDEFYNPNADTGLRWNDPQLDINWPIDPPILSEKDKSLPFLKEFDSPFVFEG